ncbi:MAG: hypothetical protein ABJA79_11120 [Parafilimonas sp.]
MGSIKIILSVVFIVCTHFSAHAYTDTLLYLTQTKFIQGNYTDFYVDNLNNIYLISGKSKITKLNDKGDSSAVYNDVRRYSNIFSLDVTNPFKIVLYYKDFSTLVILDRFLNAINTIDLRTLNILQAKAVALSYDNNYWVFDELNNKLKKLDDKGNLLLETADFRVLFSESFSPDDIIDDNGYLYLYDESSGWKLFDYYGAFKKNIPAPHWKNVMAQKSFLTGHDEIHFYKANTETTLIQSYQLPPLNNAFSHLPDTALNNKFSHFNTDTTLHNLSVQHLDMTLFIKAVWQMNTLYILNSNGLSIFAVQ